MITCEYIFLLPTRSSPKVRDSSKRIHIASPRLDVVCLWAGLVAWRSCSCRGRGTDRSIM